MNKNNILKGFTLAEVLLTLIIIGVIAATTIPGIITNTQNREHVIALKKFVYEFNQALLNYSAKQNCTGDLVCSELFKTTGSSTIRSYQSLSKLLQTELSTSQICLSANNNGNCWANNIKYLDGTSITSTTANHPAYSTKAKAILAGGMLISLNNYSATGACTFDRGDDLLNQSCASIFVDVNGKKGPNQYGRDTFEFIITKNATLYPRGGQNANDGNAYFPWNDSDASVDDNKCIDASIDIGFGCAGRIMEEGWEINY